jgi:hypothetical protein
VGLVIAHQNLDQFDQKLRAAVLSSTSTKLVGGLSAKDAGIFAKEMNCEPEFCRTCGRQKAIPSLPVTFAIIPGARLL